MLNDSPNTPAGLLGKSVAEVLKALELDLAQASRHDEPPGKLRALSFSFAAEGPEAIQAIGIYLKYDSQLFSEGRDWADAAILRTEVSGVRLKWESKAEDFGGANPRVYY